MKVIFLKKSFVYLAHEGGLTCLHGVFFPHDGQVFEAPFLFPALFFLQLPQ